MSSTKQAEFSWLEGVPRDTPAEVRFWEKVLKTEDDGCWEWQAYRDDNGYGSLTFKGKVTRAHRVAFELTYGPLAKGTVVRHYECDNPPCARPDHLRAGTQKDNIHDMDRKGRRGKRG